jgi:hypothetical protein
VGKENELINSIKLQKTETDLQTNVETVETKQEELVTTKT